MATTILPPVRPVHPIAALLLAVAACSSVAPIVPPRAGGVAGSDQGPRFMAGPPIQCVPFAREVSGVDLRGNANTWWSQAAGRYPQTNRPEPGSVMVMRSSGLGHVAVVRRVLSPRVVLVDHANWHGRGEVAVSVPVRDVSPDNSWSEVNVWWLDTNQWGSKSYQIEGFILPR
jgi:hypothetical protein